MEEAAVGSAAEIFSWDRKSEQAPIVKDLHSQIGQLSMEQHSALGRRAGSKAMIDKEKKLPMCPS